MTGSNREFIFLRSQSYWRLTNQGDVVMLDLFWVSQWVTDAASTDYEILPIMIVKINQL